MLELKGSVPPVTNLHWTRLWASTKCSSFAICLACSSIHSVSFFSSLFPRGFPYKNLFAQNCCWFEIHKKWSCSFI